MLRDTRPESYQEIDGKRLPIDSRYDDDGQGYGFVLGAYDPAHPVVIDPGLVYSTYLGGSVSEQALGLAVDNAGNAYVTGSIFLSANFPTSVGAFDTTIGGTNDAFVTKFDPAGALVYSTYLGGSSGEAGTSIAVDAAGRAFVFGITSSPDFPTALGAFDRILGSAAPPTRSSRS